jgi:hypothetical protein
MFSCCNNKPNTDTTAEIAGATVEDKTPVVPDSKPEPIKPAPEIPAPAPAPVETPVPKEAPKPSYPSPTVDNVPGGTKQWTVTLSSKPLGANVEPSGSQCVVSKVLTSGAVAAWNKGNPTEAIVDGDVILSANRMGPNYPDITKAVMESTGMIKLEVQRKYKQVLGVTLVKEPGMKLGLTIEPSHSNQWLTVIELPGSDTMCSKFNDRFSNVGIKPGDIIVEVDGTGGSEEMIGALQSFMKGTSTDQVKITIHRK